MANFNEEGLRKKFQNLDMTTQCIQTMSLWLIHHKKHAHVAVNIWYKEMMKATGKQKLSFMYLANEIIQTSKKKGPEYNKEFALRLPRAFKHLGTVQLEPKQKNGLMRLLDVWEERGVYDHVIIKEFRKRLGLAGDAKAKRKSTSPLGENDSYTPSKPHCKSGETLDAGDFPEAFDTEQREYKKKLQLTDSNLSIPVSDEEVSPIEHVDIPDDTLPDVSAPVPAAAPLPALKTSLLKPPPDPEELIQSLQDLENAATADAEVRKNIASLPSSISDVSGLEKINDIDTAHGLEKNVNEALEMLETYNKRLSTEMENRKGVAKMLHNYISHQKDLLAQTEETLEVHHRKTLRKVQKVQLELNAHLQNLPDISKLPKLGGSLTPLPSAGDLFT